MIFEEHITVLTTHTASNKKEAIIKIAHGILTYVAIAFPEGCHGLVHTAIYHHEHSVFPSTEGMTIAGDGETVGWDEYYESYQPPYELKVKLWGVGLDYDHVITVRVVVLPRKAVLALAIVDAIKGILGALSPKRIFTSG